MKELELATEQSRFDRAEHMTLDEAHAAGVEYVYWPGGDVDGEDTTPIDYVMDASPWHLGAGDWPYDRPLFVWAMRKDELRLDASRILERACEDLHEESLDSITDAAKAKLQFFLDDWAEKHGGGCTTYHPDYTRAILLPPVDAEEDSE